MNIDSAIVAGAIAGAITGSIVAVIVALGVLRAARRSAAPSGGGPLRFWRTASGPLTRRYTQGRAPAPAVTPATGSRIGPFDRFDDGGKRVLALAQDEAIRFNHNYIGTEHLLLGLVLYAEGVAARTLQELGVELAKVRTTVEFIIGRGDAPTSPSDITLSPRTKKVIELAIDESRRMRKPQVSSEHILLGLVDEGEGIASGVLDSLGVSMDRAREKVIEVLTREGTPPPSDYVAPRRQRRSGPLGGFDDRARRVFAFAQEEAFRMGHRHIGTEHLLVGLGRLTEMPVADQRIRRIFEELKLTLEGLRAEVIKFVPREENQTPPHELTLSPRAKRIIELAVQESGNDKPALPEHILLAIGREGEGVAAKILLSLSATPERVREVIEREQGDA